MNRKLQRIINACTTFKSDLKMNDFTGGSVIIQAKNKALIIGKINDIMDACLIGKRGDVAGAINRLDFWGYCLKNKGIITQLNGLKEALFE